MATGEDTSEPAPPGTPWRLFALIGGSTLLLSLNYSLIFVAFGTINKTFSAQASVVSWALTGFSITSAALLVPAGWMSDRFGRERIFLAGLALFTVGSSIVASAPVVGVLIAGRVVQAIGLVLESSASLPILLDAFPRSQRATVVGGLGATGGAAAAIGPAIGGALVDTIGWRATIALNVPAGIALCIVVLRRMPMHRAPRTATAVDRAPPDLLGVAALAAAMGSLVLAITKTSTWGVADARTLTAALAAVVAMIVVVVRSGRHPDPILFLPLFRDESYRRGVVLNVLVAGSFSGTFFAFIQLLTRGWGFSTLKAGIAVAIVPLFGGPLSFVAGRLVDRRGPRVVIVPGSLLIAAAGLIMALTVSSRPQLVQLWLPVGALYGIGVGFAHAACHATALRYVPSERLGIGGAMSRIGMELGGVISVAVAVALVSAADDPIAGVRTVTLLLSGVCTVGALLALRLRPNRSARTETAHEPATA
jgi:MFS family permease